MNDQQAKQLAAQALESGDGIARLTPTWVPRSFCVPGRRLRLHTNDLYALGANRGGIDERWFSSTTKADNGPLTTGQFELAGFTTSFVNGGDPDPTDYFKLEGIATEAEPNGNNTYRLEDQELDALSAEQATSADMTKRIEIIKKMQQIMYDQAYVIPMYARLNVDAANKRITGIKPSATGLIFWNMWEWDVTN